MRSHESHFVSTRHEAKIGSATNRGTSKGNGYLASDSPFQDFTDLGRLALPEDTHSKDS